MAAAALFRSTRIRYSSDPSSASVGGGRDPVSTRLRARARKKANAAWVSASCVRAAASAAAALAFRRPCRRLEGEWALPSPPVPLTDDPLLPGSEMRTSEAAVPTGSLFASAERLPMAAFVFFLPTDSAGVAAAAASSWHNASRAKLPLSFNAISRARAPPS
eukprot:scaffold1740_cov109-Isochrysis_galbana.AAC.3